jgi:hypothetical protein
MYNTLPEGIASAIQEAKESLQPVQSSQSKTPLSSEMIESFAKINKQHINRILASQAHSAKLTQSKSVSVEFGHIYTDEDFTVEGDHAKTLIAGSTLSQILQQNGYQTSNVLFVDDYNPEVTSNFSLFSYLEFAADHAAYFDYVVYESDMQSVARAVIDFFCDQNLTVQNRFHLQIPKKGSLLFTEDSEKYSCALLDASFALIRMQLLEASALNVLDSTYKPQQKRVRSILSQVSHSLGKSLMQYYT